MKITITKLYYFLLPLFLITLLFWACDEKSGDRLYTKDSAFFLNEKPITIVAGEIHYARIPREYWAHRLDLMKALGVNTITTPVFWNLHEPREGEFDFKGQNDIAEFCDIAQQKGLMVWLRIGPYVGADWDMGGLPWWLLKDSNIRLRSTQPEFMDRVGLYLRRLSKELALSQMSKGGNIALIQVEEADALSAGDKKYISSVKDSVIASGFDSTILTQAVNSHNILQIADDELLLTVEISNEIQGMEQFVQLRKVRTNSPMISSSMKTAGSAVWNDNSSTANMNRVFLRVFELLEKEVSLNIDVLCGGTSFGSMAGASLKNGEYVPSSASYNPGAIIKEWGRIDNQFWSMQKTIHRHTTKGAPSDKEQLQGVDLLTAPNIVLNSVAPLFDNLPQSIISKKIQTMEAAGIGYGGVLYVTKLPSLPQGTELLVTRVHDYAQIFINDEPLIALDRRKGEYKVELPSIEEGSKLSILVDATGRVGNLKDYKDYKGITQKVEYLKSNDEPVELLDWEIYPISTDYKSVSGKNYTNLPQARVPGYYSATFKKPDEGDMFLFMGDWSKAEVWINGNSLGRYWNVGPQKTLYLPGCWLKDGDNEIIILDWIGPTSPTIKVIDYPVLD